MQYAKYFLSVCALSAASQAINAAVIPVTVVGDMTLSGVRLGAFMVGGSVISGTGTFDTSSRILMLTTTATREQRPHESQQTGGDWLIHDEFIESVVTINLDMVTASYENTECTALSVLNFCDSHVVGSHEYSDFTLTGAQSFITTTESVFLFGGVETTEWSITGASLAEVPVPVPAAAYLFGSALLAGVGLKRGKRS